MDKENNSIKIKKVDPPKDDDENNNTNAKVDDDKKSDKNSSSYLGASASRNSILNFIKI